MQNRPTQIVFSDSVSLPAASLPPLPQGAACVNGDRIHIHLTEQVFQCQAGNLSTGVRFVISLTEFGARLVFSVQFSVVSIAEGEIREAASGRLPSGFGREWPTAAGCRLGRIATGDERR
jgi:hypothetical protein